MKELIGKRFRERFTDKVCKLLSVGNWFVMVEMEEGKVVWPISKNRFNRNYEVIDA